MNQLSRICPITDAEAERFVHPATVADLAARITAVPVPAADHQPARPRGRPHARPQARPQERRQERQRQRQRERQRVPQRARHRWSTGAPLAVALAVMLVVVTVLVASRLLGSGRPAGSPRPPGRASNPTETTIAAHVLSFTTSNGYTTVIVRNPLADPGRYRAELAAHHLNITLELVPASPSLVGTLVYIGEPSGGPDLQTITAQGRCYTGGGGAACPVGVRIPVGFRGQAEVVFGRAARPGEHYESTADAAAPGEVMHGMSYVGDTVARVLAMLAQRDVTVPVFNENQQGYASNVAHVPGTWYVYGAGPWGPGQVMLMVGPTRTPPASQAPQPGTPVVTPTA